MQLGKNRNGRIRQALGLVTANLFVATHGYAEAPLGEQTVSDLGTASIDTSVLFYKEDNGRVKAVEPVSSVQVTGEDGDVFTARVTYDSLTGATPNGAAIWDQAQTFTTPAAAPGQTQAVTSASGNRTLVTVPGTGTVVSQYSTPANELPIDSGFVDQRYAFDLGYTGPVNTDTNFSFGLAASKEKDFRSWSGNVGLSEDLFNNNTTVALGLNYEHDMSAPFFGTPAPLTEMSGDGKGPSQSKTVTSLMAGITQIMTRNWLLQLNYEVGTNKGYQNDPYKIISVVDDTGTPLHYLYEGRPDKRIRQSIYLANKVAVGPTVTDLSVRYYHDDWGISSITGELSEHIPVTRNLYIEPEYHYYKQTAADFFHYYLRSTDPTPDYASSDYRLGDFHADTLGIRVGYQLSPQTQLYAVAEDYRQHGNGIDPNAPGVLAGKDLFAGVHATSYILGFNYKFQL